MCDPKEIADLLGKFFESTFVEEPIDEIPSLDTVKISETISDLTFDVLEVRKILKVLNISKSHGPDGIHPKLLKSLSDCPDFVTSLTQMFQSCYDEGFIPRIWKDANIIALHKKEDKLDPKNDRSISLKSIVSKCFEKVLRNHILSHVESYIVKQQNGFRSGRSCLSNLLDCMYQANGMIDEDGEVDLLYLDFMKAFDSVRVRGYCQS